MTEAFALWRRLDMPGHDACRLEQIRGGWRLSGCAVFGENGVPAALAYCVEYDEAWATRRGGVRGFAGGRAVDVAIAREDGGWTLNGSSVPGLEHLVDLDFGFTPATNLPQVRRIPAERGASVELPAAWLDEAWTLSELAQRYERRDAGSIWYESPTAGYAGLLELAPSGLVRRYPGLWEAELL
jgi:hypothetical protein